MDINRSNVIPFGRTERPAPEQASEATNTTERQADRKPLGPTVARAAATAGRGALRAVLYVLFLLLFWLRGPVRFLFGLVATGSFITLPIIWLTVPDGEPMKTTALWGLAGAGFGASAFLWFYDTLLMRLAPEPILFTQ